MPLSHRLRHTGRLLAIGALLIATYLLFAVTAMRVALKVREVPVPDLRNRTVAEATAILENEGLVLSIDESGRLDPKIPAGHHDSAAHRRNRAQRSTAPSGRWIVARRPR